VKILTAKNTGAGLLKHFYFSLRSGNIIALLAIKHILFINGMCRMRSSHNVCSVAVVAG
jgi:hypothetical protein